MESKKINNFLIKLDTEDRFETQRASDLLRLAGIAHQVWEDKHGNGIVATYEPVQVKMFTYKHKSSWRPRLVMTRAQLLEAGRGKPAQGIIPTGGVGTSERAANSCTHYGRSW